MGRFVAWLQGSALALGGPGLFLIGYFDSSFLSFPEVNDLLLMLMVMQHKERLLYYCVAATLGSVLGCLTIYYVARAGGEAFMRRRFHERHIDRGLALFRRYGLLVVAVPAVLPPPAPFKIFVLLAGVAEVSVWQFVSAIAIARFARYFVEGLLAAVYGDASVTFLKTHARDIGVWMSAAAVVVWLAWYLLRRWRAGGEARA